MFTPPSLNLGLYMDYNATSPLKPAVKEAMQDALGWVGNASSVHKWGRSARLMIEEARESIAQLVNAKASAVVFTSGATEANNCILKTAPVESIIVSAIEHPSILKVSEHLKTKPVRIAPVTKDGVIDMSALEKLLHAQPAPCLVSVMWVNNETGVIQPIAEIAKLVRRYHGFLHVDAVQAAGRIAIDVAAMQVDFLSLSAHKMGGPQGMGALILQTCFDIDAMPPLLEGGAQEQKRRAGTENISGAIGFGVAAKEAAAHLNAYADLAKMRDRLEQHIVKNAPDAAVVFGQDAPRVANTSMIALKNVPSETQMIHFDLAGIALSNGSACSSGTVTPSHVLTAMGYDDSLAHSAIRVSLGFTNTANDIDFFIKTWDALYARIQKRQQQK